MTSNLVLRDFRDIFDSGDKWGSAMGALFTVEGEMYMRGLDSVGGFKPGAVSDPRERDDYLFEVCEEVDDDDLVYAARVLNRYVDLCRRAGLNY